MASKLSLLVVVCGLVGAVCAGRDTYHGHKVYGVNPTSQEEVEDLQEFLHKYHEIDVWTDHIVEDGEVDIHVTPQQEFILDTFLRLFDIPYQVKVEDLEEAVQRQFPERHVAPSANFAFDQYHTLAEIEAYIENVTSVSDLAESHVAGSTYEGRNIYVVKLSTDHSANRPAIWLDGGIHAREWVSPATMLYFIDYFVSHYGSDAEITSLLDNMDFYIMPAFNSDGYQYTWTTNRMWRKTRSVNQGSSCYGCDPNRNFDFHWAEVGVSTNPCSETFPGPSAFSEVEVRSVMEYMEQIPNQLAYFAYHSYSQFYMLPYGYTSTLIPDYTELMDLLKGATDALNAVHGMVYRYDNLINLVGPNSGGSVDYTYGALGIKYSIGVEFRDRGQTGFLLPPEQIIPNSEENLAALLHILNYIMQQEL